MRKLFMLAGLALGGLLLAGAADDEGAWEEAGAPPASAPAASNEPQPAKAPTCVVTGLPWLESSTRVEAIFRVDGQRQRGKFISLAYMLIQYKLLKEEGHDVMLETVSVLDFASFGTGSERMIPVNDDWSNVVFISTETALKGSKEPYFAAFSAIEDIEGALKATPGKVLSYEAVMKRLLNALRTEDEDEAVVEDEAARMRDKFRGFDPTADPDE